MSAVGGFETVHELLREGRFKQATGFLASYPAPSRGDERTWHELLSSELHLEMGEVALGERRAMALAQNSRHSAVIRARAERVLARTSFYRGSFVDSKLHAQRARQAASASGELKLQAQAAVTEL